MKRKYNIKTKGTFSQKASLKPSKIFRYFCNSVAKKVKVLREFERAFTKDLSSLQPLLKEAKAKGTFSQKASLKPSKTFRYFCNSVAKKVKVLREFERAFTKDLSSLQQLLKEAKTKGTFSQKASLEPSKIFRYFCNSVAKKVKVLREFERAFTKDLSSLQPFYAL